MIEAVITKDPIKEQEWIDKFRNNSIGAITTFIGTTREIHDNRIVLELEYHCYEPLAIKQLLEIIKDTILKYDLLSCGVVHRIGTVSIKETSIVCICTSVHRRNALLGLEYLIDKVKLSVCVYKKEVYEDGFVYLENQESRGYILQQLSF